MTKLERELAHLKQRTLEMGALAESMVTAAAAAITRPDRSVVQRVRDLEPRVDDLQIEIDREAIRLMTLYSPAARDLRFLLMVARINSELERIGDQAVNACEYVELLLSHPPSQPLQELSQMSSLALMMLREALHAFDGDDAHRARAVMGLDDEVDDIEERIVRDVLERKASDHEIATRSMGLLIARSLERIADHATNICEEVFYVVEGQDIRHRA
jgi:phosphate transport system protein